jgi:branched-chain amino acid transport system substrate-binding protein
MKSVFGGATIILTLVIATLGGAHTVDPLKVGIVIPLTAEHARLGEIAKNSFVLAVDAINRAGGIQGRPVSLIFEDDNGQADLARSAAEKLIVQDEVLVLTGAIRSESGLEIAAVAQERRVPFLVTTAALDEITEHSGKYVFRIAPPVSEYLPPLLSFLEKVVKPPTLAIVYENTLFGKEAAEDMAKAFRKQGGAVIAQERYEQGVTDFKSILVNVREARPDIVLMASSSIEGAVLVRQARELNLDPKLFVGAAQVFTLSQFMLVAGEAADYVFSIDLWNPRLPYTGAQKYFDDYVMRFLSFTNYHGAEAYASIQVIADALKRAKSFTSEDVRHALAETDMETVFGPVRFVSQGKKTQQNSVRTYLGQWQGGVLETVWPPEFATGPFVYPVPPWSGRP